MQQWPMGMDILLGSHAPCAKFQILCDTLCAGRTTRRLLVDTATRILCVLSSGEYTKRVPRKKSENRTELSEHTDHANGSRMA